MNKPEAEETFNRYGVRRLEFRIGGFTVTAQNHKDFHDWTFQIWRDQECTLGFADGSASNRARLLDEATAALDSAIAAVHREAGTLDGLRRQES